MKTYTISIILSFFVFYSYANSTHLKTGNVGKNELKLNVDTLNIHTFSIKNERWYENNNMPWIFSLGITFIGLLINLIIAYVTIRNAKNNLTNQINASIQVSREQINASKEMALSEIKNAREISENEFKATINSKNRQEWINEVRHCTSEFLAQCTMMAFEMGQNNYTEGKIKVNLEKIVYNKSKIEMLLNLDKEEQSSLMKPINDMLQLLIEIEKKKGKDLKGFKELQDKISAAGRQLFGIHWAKIKNLSSD